MASVDRGQAARPKFPVEEISVKQWKTIKPGVQRLRKEMTEAERQLWQRLRNKQVLGFKFRRQHAIGGYIVDFYCPAAALVVEVDGPIDEQRQEEDRARQAFLEQSALQVLRFTNDQVMKQLDNVIAQISATLNSPTPSPVAR